MCIASWIEVLIDLHEHTNILHPLTYRSVCLCFRLPHHRSWLTRRTAIKTSQFMQQQQQLIVVYVQYGTYAYVWWVNWSKTNLAAGWSCRCQSRSRPAGECRPTAAPCSAAAPIVCRRSCSEHAALACRADESVANQPWRLLTCAAQTSRTRCHFWRGGGQKKANRMYS